MRTVLKPIVALPLILAMLLLLVGPAQAVPAAVGPLPRGESVALLAYSNAPAGPDVVGAWSPGPNMLFPQAYKPSVMLPNGRVLLAGGRGNPGHLATTEIYDPVANTWTQVADMPVARAMQQAILFPPGHALAGKVLMIAGWNGAAPPLNTAVLYDPAANTWRYTVTSMRSPRVYHMAALLGNGEVLVAGGWDGGNTPSSIVASAEFYNPTTDAWIPAPSMLSPRADATFVTLPSGRIMVAGGWNGTADLRSTEFYNPATNSWSPGPDMPSCREGYQAVWLDANRLLIAGGYCFGALPTEELASAVIYNASSNTWSTAASMSLPRDLFMAIRLQSGKVLAAGGLTTGVNGGADYILQTAEIYDPATNTWAATGNLRVPRYGDTETLVQLPSGLVMMAGGSSGNTLNQNTVDMYDPAGAPVYGFHLFLPALKR